MPTNRRRCNARRRPDISELNDHRRYELESGPPAPFPFEGIEGDIDAMREAWREHGPAVLAEFIAANPGRRPFGWWMFEHQQERPVIDSTVSQSLPAKLRTETFGFLHTDLQSPAQESGEGYLRRHGLLTPKEAARLGYL